MTAEHWHQIKELFEEAQRRAPDARAAWLSAACDGDTDLHGHVERLLAFDAGADAYFDTLGGDLLGERTPETSTFPEAVGPWRVVREIGYGGMGQVLEAERADGLYDQRVALKLVRPGLAPTLVARFRAERRMLAALGHRGIARLLDGGVADDGRPYFAMEYVEGEPLFAYADAARLGVEARLRLFLGVCDAVAYAHRQLIVHRDLKPSNILVTAEGAPKLLDFGIAKLLDEEGDALTQTGHHLMTPEYAAPEQVTGAPISTATDVYTLGVLLFELLTGHRPYIFDKRSPQAIARAICEQDPSRPSTVVERPVERRSVRGETRTVAPDEVAQRRATSTEQLHRRLVGDLDTICLKALCKEPEERYASVEALADDVRRHLDGLPLKARPATVGYRVRKFVRRHRVGVAMGVALFLALAVGLGAALWQADRAEAEAERAALEAEKADRVTEFVVGLLRAEDPREAQGDTVTVRDVLERGLPEIAGLGDQPEVQAQLYLTTSEVYQSLGDYALADSLALRALNLRKALYGPQSAEVAGVQIELVRSYLDQAKLSEAKTLIGEAIATLQETVGDHEDTATALDFLGQIEQYQQNYEAAEAALLDAVAMQRRLKPGAHEGLATSLSNLGMLYHYRSRLAEAEALYREALTAQREILGDRHPYVNIMRHNLAHLYLSKEEFGDAAALFKEVVAADRAVYGANHPDMIPGLAGHAMTLNRQGNFEQAQALYREAIRVATNHFGAKHPITLFRLRQYGIHFEEQGRYDEAADIIDDLIAEYRRNGHINEGVAMRLRAGIHRKQGEAERALDLLRRTQAFFRERHEDASHPAHAVVLGDIALTLQALGRYDEAEATMRDALAQTEEAVGSDHLDVVWHLNKLGNVLRDREDYAEAESTYDRAETTLDRLSAPTGPSAATLALDRSRLALARGDAEAAERQAQHALTWLSDVLRDAHPSVAEAHGALGRALLAQDRYAEAEPHLLTHQRSLSVSTSPERAETEALLGTLYQRWGRPGQATAYERL